MLFEQIGLADQLSRWSILVAAVKNKVCDGIGPITHSEYQQSGLHGTLLVNRGLNNWWGFEISSMFHQTIRQDTFKGGSSSCCGGPNGSCQVNWSCAEMKCFQTEDKDCKVNMWLVSLELVLDPFLTQTSPCSQVAKSTWFHEDVFKLLLFCNKSKFKNCYTRRKERIHWNSVWDLVGQVHQYGGQ